jgi:flagellar hook-associated protein 1 FlgK
MGLFQIMRSASITLSAFQLASEITGDNIANVNTKGYVRQKVILQENPSYPSPYGGIGTGVRPKEIKRIIDMFVENQVEKETSIKTYWDEKTNYYQLIERVLQEPSDTNINGLLNNFWSVLEELSITPESISLREDVLNVAQVLIDRFHYTYRGLKDQKDYLNYNISQINNQINLLSQQLAKINEKIIAYPTVERVSNELKNEQDRIIKQLSELFKVNVVRNDDGTVNVYIGGSTLVIRNKYFEIEAIPDVNGNYYLYWKLTGQIVNFTSGKIKSWFDLRDVIIPDYMNKMDNLAYNLVTEINNIHVSGYGLDNSTGNNFFEPLAGVTDASLNIRLDPSITPEKIAASDAINEPGNNKNLLNIINLKNQQILGLGNATFDEYYQEIISQLSKESSSSQSIQNSQNLLLQSIQKIWESISGVNLDEEIAYLQQYQYAYQAAAKVISVASELIETLLKIY